MSAVAAGCYYARQTLAPYVRPLVAKMYPELASGPSNASDAQAEALALAMRQQSAQISYIEIGNERAGEVIYPARVRAGGAADGRHHGRAGAAERRADPRGGGAQGLHGGPRPGGGGERQSHLRGHLRADIHAAGGAARALCKVRHKSFGNVSKRFQKEFKNL
eukprot:1192288-Prorocentrum_minimum.AAC.4